MELYINDIQEWSSWCEKKYNFSKSQAVAFAASITNFNINSVWDWVSGRRNPSKTCIMVLSAFAHYKDHPDDNPFTWIYPPISQKDKITIDLPGNAEPHRLVNGKQHHQPKTKHQNEELNMKTIKTKTTNGTDVIVTINFATVTINLPLADGTRVDVHSRYGKVNESNGDEMWYGYHNTQKCVCSLPDEVTSNIMRELAGAQISYNEVRNCAKAEIIEGNISLDIGNGFWALIYIVHQNFEFIQLEIYPALTVELRVVNGESYLVDLEGVAHVHLNIDDKELILRHLYLDTNTHSILEFNPTMTQNELMEVEILTRQTRLAKSKWEQEIANETNYWNMADARYGTFSPYYF